jgi:putative ABC transport system substrate-binding protein
MRPAYQAFIEELRRTGFSEGETLIVDQKPTDQDLSVVPVQAAEMVRSNVDVLVALGSEQALQACIGVSRTIPIVFVANNFDPITGGYVQSLARPGGNVTGVSLRQTELAEKQVELLTQAFPDRTKLAVIWDRISAHQYDAAQRRAEVLRLDVLSLKMENPPYDVATAFRSLVDTRANMLLALTSQYFGPHREQIIALAIRQRLPAMFIFRPYAEAGGLMSYGVDPVAMYRQGATLVAKILKGAKTTELPVEQPTKYEMVVNLKTAKSIGIELPTAILLRADEVIE